MPRPSSNDATVERAGDTMRFAGPLTREAIAALWRLARPLDGVRVFDLTAVSRVDSAGIALLAELAARLPAAPSIVGEPDGLRALCAAYRLGPTLAFT